MVFKTVINRNIRLSEAPSFGEDILTYDATSKGAKDYLARKQIIKRNKAETMAKSSRKPALGKGLSAILNSAATDIEKVPETCRASGWKRY